MKTADVDIEPSTSARKRTREASRMGQPQLADSRPIYAITSVDNALLLLEILRTEGTLRVSDAAAQIGVARSTAHRLLAMLCYRGYASKTDEHEYVAGQALRTVSSAPGSTVQNELRPTLLKLSGELGETVHLMTLKVPNVHFLDSVEGIKSTRVGSRVGRIMPAHLTSGGQALLAELKYDELVRRYPDGPPPELRQQNLVTWFTSLRKVRQRGFGVNIGLTERGLTAVGATVHGRDGGPIGAVCVSAPGIRLNAGRLAPCAAALIYAIAEAEARIGI
jgi:IclR family acetate operon transcriptional repressor